jgi:D-alanyl-D-alanine carboxypeptidase (penicillin-binding protein 5/6)
MMNEEAQRLGATQTNFVTPNGLDDPDHYTTAYDLYLIFNECLKYDVFKDAISQSSYTAKYIHNGEEYSRTYDSTNYYLLGYKTPPEGVSVIGGKTGTTDNAGLCLILYVEDDDGNGYISVILGCIDKDTLYESMSNLLSNIRN